MRVERKNNVIVRIRSEQRLGGEHSASEVFVTGLLRSSPDGFTLRYEEILGDDDERSACRSLLTVSNAGEVLFTRSGAYSAQMRFEMGSRYLSAYRTPFGELSFGVYTRNVTVERTEDRVCILLEYTVDNAGEIISENLMEITTKRRKTI